MARRMVLFSVFCMGLTWGVIYNAFRQKGEFYPSVVYLTKSRPSMAVLYAQAFVFVWLVAQIMKKLFFGSLRSAEAEHMVEQFWYAVPETCLMFTAFREDLSPSFVAIVTFLFVIKAFHWLAEDRIDYMERSPVITLKFHARASSLLLTLGTVDAFLLHYAFNSVMAHGPSVQLVFGLEYAILLIMLVGTMMKYILHTIDLQNENPWENKVVYMLYADVVLGFLKVSLYFAFMSFMLHVHMFPLYIMRRTYLAVKSFKKSVSDVILSRKAIANLNRYPDVTPEELQNIDNVCIICREEMTTQVKRLPCNHIFHLACLRSWFQRQQTCPTCRESVLRRTVPPPAAPQQPRAANNPAAAADRPPFPPPGFPPPMMWPGMFPPQAGAPPPQFPPQAGVPPPQDGAPPPQGAAPPPQQAPLPQQGTDQTQGGTASDGSTANGAPPPAAAATPTGMVPPFMMPPPPFPPPFFMPGMTPNMGGAPPTFTIGPTPPTNLDALSEEELRQLEGVERHNVEARIRLLQRIQSLLDNAVTLMSQYSAVATPMDENITMSTSASNFVSQASQSEETPVLQASSQLISSKSEGIPIKKILPVEEDGATDNNTSCTGRHGDEDVNTRPADNSEIRKRRLEKLVSKEADNQPQSEETKDDKVVVADT